MTDVPRESRCVGRVGSLVLQEAADADTDAGRSLGKEQGCFFLVIVVVGFETKLRCGPFYDIK